MRESLSIKRKSTKAIDLTGMRFGSLTVLNFVESLAGSRRWLCKCDCGNEKVIRGNALRTGNTKSCGCLLIKVNKEIHKTHGNRYSLEWNIWNGMRQRCYNKKNKSYKNYGGRGIAVCDSWNNRDGFKNFLKDMGFKPTKTHSLDRIDNNGNYCPENCRWATVEEQSCNKRNTIIITIDGVSRSLLEWAKIKGMSRKTISNRIRLNWEVEDLFIPLKRQKNKL